MPLNIYCNGNLQLQFEADREVSTNYIEAWLKINKTFSLFKSPTIYVVTIKPSAVFNYIVALTRAFFFFHISIAITELELSQLYLGSD